MPKSKSEMLKVLREKRKSQGLIEVRVWVPESGKQEIKNLEKKLNKSVDGNALP